ncbi:MAG: acetyltransferase [Chloroflexota bacterium]
MRWLVIGAGGHAKVIIDSLTLDGVNDIHLLDDNLALKNKIIAGFKVKGTIAQWQDSQPDAVIVAIGNNQIRQQIVKTISIDDTHWQAVIHPRAIIAKSATIGVGTAVMAGAIINADSRVGEHCIINTGTTIDHDCVIGNYVHVAPGVNVAGGVTVGNGSLLGIGSTILPNNHIGNNTVIGAGAIVVSNIPDGVTALGIPATW